MSEKTYKTLASCGISNLIIGICILIGGISSGILMIINGARLLKMKKDILL